MFKQGLDFHFELYIIIRGKQGRDNESVNCIFLGRSKNTINTFYAPAYSQNSGWALSITPVRPVRLSVRPSVRPTSCPGHNSQTVWNIFMKLYGCMHHIETMCHEQGRQLLHFLFLNYLPLT